MRRSRKGSPSQHARDILDRTTGMPVRERRRSPHNGLAEGHHAQLGVLHLRIREAIASLVHYEMVSRSVRPNPRLL